MTLNERRFGRDEPWRAVTGLNRRRKSPARSARLARRGTGRRRVRGNGGRSSRGRAGSALIGSKGARGEAGAGRGRPESVGRSPSKLAQQGAECGVCGVSPRGVGRRFGGFRRGGGFGPPAGGVQVQCASALVGRRGGVVLAAAVATAALDRLVALMLEPFVEPEHLEQGFGYATDGRSAPVAVVPGLLEVGVDGDQPGAAQIPTGPLGPPPAEAGSFGQKCQR